jgi:hypothetical protein
MPSVTNKPLILSVILLHAIMLSVTAPILPNRNGIGKKGRKKKTISDKIIFAATIRKIKRWKAKFISSFVFNL